MCEKQPGPRCYSDSSKTLTSLDNRLGKAKSSLKACKARQTTAAKAGDFTVFSKEAKKAERLQAEVDRVQSQYNDARRDLDGTKTGLRMLDAEMANATSPRKMRELRARRSSAILLREIRKHALEMSEENRRPVIVLPGELVAA